MRNKVRRFLSMLLSVLMVITGLPFPQLQAITAFAGTDAENRIAGELGGANSTAETAASSGIQYSISLTPGSTSVNVPGNVNISVDASVKGHGKDAADVFSDRGIEAPAVYVGLDKVAFKGTAGTPQFLEDDEYNITKISVPADGEGRDYAVYYTENSYTAFNSYYTGTDLAGNTSEAADFTLPENVKSVYVRYDDAGDGALAFDADIQVARAESGTITAYAYIFDGTSGFGSEEGVAGSYSDSLSLKASDETRFGTAVLRADADITASYSARFAKNRPGLLGASSGDLVLDAQFAKGAAYDASVNANVWNAQNSDSDHRFTYRVVFQTSGEFDIPAGKIRFTIPKRLIKNRDGVYSDYYDMSLPSKAEYDAMSDADRANQTYIYEESGDDLVIYNCVERSAGEQGYFEVSYLIAEPTFAYKDMQKSDTFTVNMKAEVDGVEETADETCEPVALNTSAKLSSTEKRYPVLFRTWDDSWGARPADADDYLYVRWEICSFIPENAISQPYNFILNDVPGSPDMSVVGYKLSGASEYSSDNTDENITKDGYRFDYVLTRHKKSVYNETHDYTLQNKMITTVDPADGVDPDIVKTSSKSFTWEVPHFVYPTGHFYSYKFGNSNWNHYMNSYRTRHGVSPNYYWDYATYRLDTLQDGASDTLGGFEYVVNGYGFPYPWTLEAGADSSNGANYGKAPVTYVLTDNELFFEDMSIKEDDENMSVVIQSRDSQLAAADYEIKGFNLWSVNVNQRTYNPDTFTFEAKTNTYDPETDKVYFYTETNNSGNYELFGYYDLYTRRGSNANITSNKVTFGPGVTGYKVMYSNPYYYTDLNVIPEVVLKNSSRIMDGISDKDVIRLTNVSHFDMYKGSFDTASGEAAGTQLFHQERCAVDRASRPEYNASVKKSVKGTINNRIKKRYEVQWLVEQNEYVTIGENENANLPQDAGRLYDLIPLGTTVVPESVMVVTDTATEEDGGLDPSSYTVETIQNYKDSGRTMLVVSVNVPALFYNIYYTTYTTWESIADYGDALSNPVAYEKVGGEILHAGYKNDPASVEASNKFSSEAEPYMSNLSGNSNEQRFFYAERSHQIDAITAAISGLKKLTLGDGKQYAIEDTTTPGGIYSYQLRFANTFLTQAKDIVLFDSLENYTTSQSESSDWKGTLKSIDVTQAEKRGIRPKVYVSTVSGLDINAHHNLGETSVWSVYNGGSLANVKAIAVDLGEKADGSRYILDKGDAVAVIVYMQAPTTLASAPEDRYAKTYNDVWMSNKLSADGTRWLPFFIEQGYTAVNYHVVADVPALKVNAENTSEPVKDITFRLSGTSYYGTPVDETLTSSATGRITFRNIERGTYTLVEASGNPDWQFDSTPHTVKVGADAVVKIDGQAVTIASPKVITNKPRIHTDVKFKKKDLVRTGWLVEGVEFKLSGKSSYGNDILMYATSDNKGNVMFADVEYGVYTMREVSGPDNYMIDANRTWQVVVDENGNFGVNEAGNTEYDVGGNIIVRNEPLHSFQIEKLSSYDSSLLPNATFHLYGTSNAGNRVDKTGTTGANGILVFGSLESGTYLMEETAAPEGYDINPAKFVVKITADDTITVSNAEYNDITHAWKIVDPKKKDGEIVVTKKWIDNRTDDTRPTPVIHLATNENMVPSYARWKTSLASTFSSAKQIILDTTYTKDTLPNNAKKLDTGETNKSIYGWKDVDTGRTVTIWTDASSTLISPGLFRDMYSLAEIDQDLLNIIDTSECTDMSYMFYNCESLTSLDLGSWDTSAATTMRGMFQNCRKLTNLNVSGLDTSSVTNMSAMFNSCKALTSLDVSGFDTSKVTNMSTMFNGCEALTSLDVSGFDTSKVTNMEYMFYNCKNLTSLDLNSFNTGNVTNMAYMFCDCKGLTNLDVSSFDTGNVTKMDLMFQNCTSLTELDLSSFNTGNVTNMQSMFEYCKALTSLDLSSFNTSNVTRMISMFRYCQSLNSININSFKTSNVTSMSGMFESCKVLSSLDLSSFDTSKVTIMGSMFRSCTELKTVYVSETWTTDTVTSSNYMFEGASSLVGEHGTSLPGPYDKSYARIDNPPDEPGYFTYKAAPVITGSADTDSSFTFAKAADAIVSGIKAAGEFIYSGLTPMTVYAADIASGTCGTCPWVIDENGKLTIGAGTLASISPDNPWQSYRDKITSVVFENGVIAKGSLCNMFSQFENMTSIDFANFDTSKVTNMDYMFDRCEALTSLDVTGFDTGNITSMVGMFVGCKALTSLDVTGFNTSKVTNMNNMFDGCKALTSLDVTGFDTSNVTRMNYMFSGCKALTSLDVTGFDTSNVTRMNYMFSGCNALTSLDVTGFDTSNVTDMSYMFCDCNAFTSLDVSGFDTSNVTNMSYMFYACKALTSLDVTGFDTSNVTTMKRMFDKCGALTSLDVSGFDTGNVTDMSGMFSECNAIEYLDLSSFNVRKVTNFTSMFAKCNTLKTLNLANWTLEGQNYCNSTFYGCSALTTIYATESWNDAIQSDGNMFSGCANLVGGNGTHYSVSDKSYARIDEPDHPGYFTRYDPRLDPNYVYHSYNPDDCTITKNGDGTWTYTFHVYDDSVPYYIWEDKASVPGYTSDTFPETYGTITPPDKKYTVTNKESDMKYPGDLTIQKTVTGAPAGTEDAFEFTITLTGDGISGVQTFGSVLFNDGVGKVYLKNGESVTIKDIPADTAYTVTERESVDYTMTSSTGTTGSITEKGTASASFTNAYVDHSDDPTGGFTVTKAVRGWFEHADDEFTMHVSITGLLAGKTYIYSDGTAEHEFTADTTGDANVTLAIADGKSVTFTGLPAGAKYRVSEDGGDYEAEYTVESNVEVGTSAGVGTKGSALTTGEETVEEDEAAEVTFTNTIKRTGDIHVRKVTNPANVDFSFPFTIRMSNVPADADITSTFGRLAPDEDGNIEMTFYVAPGETAHIYGVPVNAKYTIIETANAYTASYIVTDQNGGTAIVSPTGENQSPMADLSTAEETVNEGEDVLATFTNAGVTDGKIKLTKKNEDGTKILEGAVFSFYLKGKTEALYENLITDENGEILVEHLMPGEYYFVETAAPEYYTMPNNPANRRTEYIPITEENHTSVQTVVVNDPLEEIPATILLTKKSSADNTTLVPGAEYGLYTDAECTNLYVTGYEWKTDAQGQHEEPIFAKGSTNTSGQITWSDLPWGTYYVKEITAAPDYELNADVVTVEINKDTALQSVMVDIPGTNPPKQKETFVAKTIEVNVTDTPVGTNDGEITVKKTINEWYEPFGEATFIFTLTGTSGAAEGKRYTKSVKLGELLNGSVKFNKLPYGKYTVSELAVARYKFESLTSEDSNVEVSGETAVITISKTQKTAEITYENKITQYEKFSHATSVVNHITTEGDTPPTTRDVIIVYHSNLDYNDEGGYGTGNDFEPITGFDEETTNTVAYRYANGNLSKTSGAYVMPTDQVKDGNLTLTPAGWAASTRFIQLAHWDEQWIADAEGAQPAVEFNSESDVLSYAKTYFTNDTSADRLDVYLCWTPEAGQTPPSDRTVTITYHSNLMFGPDEGGDIAFAPGADNSAVGEMCPVINNGTENTMTYTVSEGVLTNADGTYHDASDIVASEDWNFAGTRFLFQGWTDVEMGDERVIAWTEQVYQDDDYYYEVSTAASTRPSVKYANEAAVLAYAAQYFENHPDEDHIDIYACWQAEKASRNVTITYHNNIVTAGDMPTSYTYTVGNDNGTPNVIRYAVTDAGLIRTSGRYYEYSAMNGEEIANYEYYGFPDAVYRGWSNARTDNGESSHVIATLDSYDADTDNTTWTTDNSTRPTKMYTSEDAVLAYAAQYFSDNPTANNLDIYACWRATGKDTPPEDHPVTITYHNNTWMDGDLPHSCSYYIGQDGDGVEYDPEELAEMTEDNPYWTAYHLPDLNVVSYVFGATGLTKTSGTYKEYETRNMSNAWSGEWDAQSSYRNDIPDEVFQGWSDINMEPNGNMDNQTIAAVDFSSEQYDYANGGHYTWKWRYDSTCRPAVKYADETAVLEYAAQYFLDNPDKNNLDIYACWKATGDADEDTTITLTFHGNISGEISPTGATTYEGNHYVGTDDIEVFTVDGAPCNVFTQTYHYDGNTLTHESGNFCSAIQSFNWVASGDPNNTEGDAWTTAWIGHSGLVLEPGTGRIESTSYNDTGMATPECYEKFALDYEEEYPWDLRAETPESILNYVMKELLDYGITEFDFYMSWLFDESQW